MNIAPLRKSILKESAIFGGLLLFFGGIAAYLGMAYADYEQEKNKLSSAANQLLVEKRNLEDRFTQVKNNLVDYQEAQHWAEAPGLFIDPQAVRELFNDYQSRFLLKKISVEMQPIISLKDDPKYARKSFSATKSTVKVSIETASDEDVYRLIAAMQKELPGFTKITSFSISKKQGVNKDVGPEIRKTGSAPLIGAEITFEWYGLESSDPKSPFNQYTSKKHPGKPL